MAAILALFFVAGGPAAAQPAASLQWLEGRWARPFDAGRLELTWTAVRNDRTGDDAWRGVIFNVQRGGKPRLVATYDIARQHGAWRLRLQEGAKRSSFSRAEVGPDNVRFDRGWSNAGLTVITLRIMRGQLFVGHLQGTRHGAPVPIDQWFERMPAE